MGSQGVDVVLVCEKCGEECILEFRSMAEFQKYRHRLHCWGPGDEDECGGLLQMLGILVDNVAAVPPVPTRKQLLERLGRGE